MDKSQIIKKAEELAKDGNVDIVKLAGTLGIEVYTIDNGEDFDAEIKYNTDTGTFEISVNNKHSLTRKRFSIAHEIAHFVLHKDQIIEAGSKNRIGDRSSDKYDKSEEEADRLASEILMPETLVFQTISDLNIDRNSIVDKILINKIAERFNVSKLVAILRLRELKFIVPFINFA